MTGLGRGRWVSRGGVLRWQRAARRTPSTPPLPPVSCGTEQGYQRHRYLARKGADGAVWPLPVDDPLDVKVLAMFRAIADALR